MSETVTQTATCKKCGSTAVTWMKSKKTEKFYLTEVFSYGTDNERTGRTDFHSKYCGEPMAHIARQDEITRELEPQDSEQLDDVEIELLAMYVAMAPGVRAEKIAETKNAYLAARANLGEKDPSVIKLRNLIDLIEDFCAELEA